MIEPSAILAAAADRVRDLAAAAVPGPWDAALGEVDHAGPYEREMVADCGDTKTAEWVAALSPAVAPALEAWLRSCAKSMEALAAMGRGSMLNGAEVAAVQFAAALCPDLVEEKTP